MSQPLASELSEALGEMSAALFRAHSQRCAFEAVLRDLVDDDPCELDHHGYCQTLDFQPSKEEVLERRAAVAERVRRHRERQLKRRYGEDGNAVTNAVSNTVSNAPPVPSRPVPSSSVSSSGSRPEPLAADGDDRRRNDQRAIAARELGRLDHQRAIDDGIEIHSRQAHLAACIERWTASDDLAAQPPDAAAADIVAALDPGARARAADAAHAERSRAHLAEIATAEAAKAPRPRPAKEPA